MIIHHQLARMQKQQEAIPQRENYILQLDPPAHINASSPVNVCLNNILFILCALR